MVSPVKKQEESDGDDSAPETISFDASKTDNIVQSQKIKEQVT